MISLHSIRKRRQRLPHFTLPTQDGVASAHLVGICGSGMKALAEMLIGLGWNITGSDLQRPGPAMAAMRERGLRVHSGHNSRFLPQDVDVVIYSPAVDSGNPERGQAQRLNIPQLSYSEMLGLLMRDRVGVSIAGTHGKSTTTAMTASVMTDAGASPSAVIGAELCGRGINGWAGEGELFVVESCEYKQSFLDLRPSYAAILGIEPDHFDCYENLSESVQSFSEFANRVSSDGVLLVNGDCDASLAAAKSASARIVTFSRFPGCDWWAADLRQTDCGTRFRIFHEGLFFAEVSLQIPGEHNVLNALASAALCHHAGIPLQEIREGLQEFRGICRRYEHVGSWRGVTLIDDYAHHPTAVKATLQTARNEAGTRKVWCAFQPHQVSRTRALMDEFAGSFELADEILIAPTFAARETSHETSQSAAEELTSRIASKGQHARFCDSLDRIVATLEDETRPGDVLITMGAGDIDRVHHEFTRRLRRHHKKR